MGEKLQHPKSADFPVMAGVLRISFCSSIPSQLTCSVRGLRTSARRLQEAAKEEIVGIPYSKLQLGVPKESWLNEKRVAISPAATAMLVKKGFNVNVETGAGKLSQFPDEAYAAEGAKIVAKAEAFQQDITLKLRQPSIEETALLRDNATLYSYLYPGQNKELLDALAAKKMTVFGMDCVPGFPELKFSMLCPPWVTSADTELWSKLATTTEGSSLGR